MTDTFSLVKSLADCRGITGRESDAARCAAELVRAYVPDTVLTPGYVAARRGRDPQKPTLLFCAHLDQVGFIVTDITEDGFLRIGCAGGIDRRLLLGQGVTVHGTEVLHGVISILPPHLLHGEQAVPEESMLCVDLGFSSADLVRAKVRRGDAVYYDTACGLLPTGLMTGSALDDRCGAASLILAAEMLADTPELPCNVVFAFSTGEERSGRGAKLIAANEGADYAIGVDVTFGFGHGEDKNETYVLGEGPAVGVSSVLDWALSDALVQTAEQYGIPYQVEVMPGPTGTDADSLALTPGGCAAGTVSIPLRHMHTPVEVIDLSDVEQTAALLAAYAKECGK